jgi:uncharacterized protein (DUF924 family)
MPPPIADDILAFWREAGEAKWFTRDDTFDATIRIRFSALLDRAARGELAALEATPDGALALVILLDQFPRNLFRGSPRAFATDAQARDVARRALAKGFDRLCDTELAFFLNMPLVHSEALADQDRAVAFFEKLGAPDSLRSAREHRDIIARFGRFPHRNVVLGRVTTPDEQRYLDEGGFKG